MFEKWKNPVLVSLPVVLLLAWVAFLWWQVAAGALVKIKIKGYDPRDLLAGHYILYELDWEAADCSQFAGGKCPKEEFERFDAARGRFYVPQQLALALEQDIQNSANTAEMVFSYRAGYRPYARSLLINGRNWNGVAVRF